MGNPTCAEDSNSQDGVLAGVCGQAILSDASNWLDAPALSGPAFVASLDPLQARIDGDLGEAAELFAQSQSLQAPTVAIRSVPGENRVEGPVTIGDGALDTLRSTLAVGTIAVARDANPSIFGQPVAFNPKPASIPGPNTPAPSGTFQFRNGNANLNAALTVGAGARDNDNVDAGRWQPLHHRDLHPGRSDARQHHLSEADSGRQPRRNHDQPGQQRRPPSTLVSPRRLPPPSRTCHPQRAPRPEASSSPSKSPRWARALSGGVDTFTTSMTGTGTHTVTTTYAQTTNFAASASPAPSQVVN